MSSELTKQHKEEAISRAHIAAIAGAAGLLIGNTDFDYKMDGTFRRIAKINGQKGPTGFPLDWQLKASKNTSIKEDKIAYSLDVNAWNYIVGRNNPREGVPILLLLCCLHTDEAQWVNTESEELLLKKCCYWHYFEGSEITDQGHTTIKIPTSHKLTPEVLLEMLKSLEVKKFYALFAS